MPDLIGIGLQSAQDQAQAAGFYNLASHDATGQGRYQVLDRNWKVCFQTPRAGQVPSGAKIEFGAVKTDESCPSTDLNPAGAETGGSLPDFTGKSVQAARRALDTSASITAEDVSGRDRAVLMESHWKICSQTPAAASRWNGQPITFKVVKTAENCP
ncbi:hypothetical protein A8W25_19650 [Streptomyces sp. ERV7]|nr:hypothetical protein A8W25_19650 [Streptomyces sp. ERV7]